MAVQHPLFMPRIHARVPNRPLFVPVAIATLVFWALVASWPCRAATIAARPGLHGERRRGRARSQPARAAEPRAGWDRALEARGSATLPASTTPTSIASWVVTSGTDPKAPDTQTFLMVGNQVAWRFEGDWPQVAEGVSDRIDTAWKSGDLRSDLITPGKRGRQYVIRCGTRTLLYVSPALAAAQQMKTAHLTLALIDDLRSALGGMPFARQVSRGELPGERSREGVASWYGGFFNGRTAADGSRFDKTDFTVASRTLPLGTLLLIINPANSRAVLVRVTDRGPYVKGRVLDLSQRTAQVLGTEREGIAEVRYYILPSEPTLAAR